MLRQANGVKTISRNGFPARQTGLTLIELMAAVGVTAVLAGLAVPSIAALLPAYRLKRAATDLYSNMQFVKMSAVRNNTPWAIVFDPAEEKYAVCSGRGEDGSWTTLQDNTVVKTVFLAGYGSGVGFGSGRASRPIGGTFDADGITYRIPGANVLQFNARGTCGSGYVYLRNNEDGAFGVGTRWTGVVLMRRWFPVPGVWR
jgi:type II secretory pathway pseudopilin PulG